MDLAFDHLRMDSTGFSSSIAATSGDSQRSCLPDWNGLKARFLAAHALRRELERACAIQPAGGSFLIESEPVLAAVRGIAARGSFKSSRHVNPTASGNGKPLSAFEDYIVGNPDPASEEVYD